MSEKVVMHFATSVEAAAHIESILEDGDVVLVKGSQGIRMERIVRPLLADFADVSELVRQDKEWLKR
jgi:UDP-N-acetylmuramyl pentapeptide synthase